MDFYRYQQMPESQVDITLGVLRNLTKLERLVVALYYYERFSLEEIAAVLKKPKATVTAALNRVHQKMALAMQAEVLEEVASPVQTSD